MRVKQEKENRLFEAKDWSDLFEYTSETDDDTGCGSAGYDGRDGPRERGEEELMSPPMQPNGGGGSNCPYGTYSSYDNCLSYNGGDVEYCDCICLNSGCDDDDDGLPEPPAGAECDVYTRWWGTETVCNEDATDWVAEITSSSEYYGITVAFAIGSLLTGNVPAGVFSIEMGYLAYMSGSCSGQDEKLVIEYTWGSAQSTLSCR